MYEALQNRLSKYFSLYMIRIMIAAPLAWFTVHSIFGSHYSYFAPLAAILITQGSVKSSLEKGYYRVLGVFIGGTVSLIVGEFLNVGPLTILLILLIGIGIATALHINPLAVSQVGVTSVLALTFYEDHYVLWRLSETSIGVVIALAVSMIIVPPNRFVKVKAAALEGSLVLADALKNSLGIRQGSEGNRSLLEQAGKLLSHSSEEQKEMFFTLTHYQHRDELKQLIQVTKHLAILQSYVKATTEDIRLLPAHHASSDWMKEVLGATADCIALYGTRALSDDKCEKSLTDCIKRARDLQQTSFSELQGNCSLASIRDLGAAFSHLNRVLEEVERAQAAPALVAARPSMAETARALRFIKKGFSQKL